MELVPDGVRVVLLRGLVSLAGIAALAPERVDAVAGMPRAVSSGYSPRGTFHLISPVFRSTALSVPQGGSIAGGEIGVRTYSSKNSLVSGVAGLITVPSLLARVIRSKRQDPRSRRFATTSRAEPAPPRRPSRASSAHSSSSSPV